MTQNVPTTPATRHRQQHQQVPPRRHPVPAVEVDAEEDRLDEERRGPRSANGRPSTSPKRPIRPGHSRPISKLSTVPETAPIANSTAETFDHRSGEPERHRRRRGRCPRRCTTKIIVGKATPKQARTMCQPSENAICSRAGSRPGGVGGGEQADEGGQRGGGGEHGLDGTSLAGRARRAAGVTMQTL